MVHPALALPPAPEDAVFDLGQLFYSRTDKRGVIVAGNAVFQTVSGFDWGNLIGAPHRIVRNHDTPRAVFRIMWDHLRRDEPVVAYVRNKTASGQGYWVIATVFPLDDGYLSVRIKPTSGFFAKARAIYAHLAQAEQTLSVEQSAAQMLQQVRDLGFADYRAFGAHAIAQEFRPRSREIQPHLQDYFNELDRIRAGFAEIVHQQTDLLSEISLLRDLPTNMRIIASRLEPSGGPLTAMSDIYAANSLALCSEIREFAAAGSGLVTLGQDAFERANFAKICALLKSETESRSARENLIDVGFDAVAEIARLRDLRRNLQDQEKTAMQAAQRFSAGLKSASYDLRRAMLGLDTIRVMGLVESGRLGDEGSRIAATMDQIGSHHTKIMRLLQRIRDTATRVNTAILGLPTFFAKVGGDNLS